MIVEEIKLLSEDVNEANIINRLVNFVKENYGQFVYIDPKTLKKDEDRWEITGGVYYPYYIEEAGSIQPHLRYRNFPDILYIEASIHEKKLDIKSITRKQLIELMEKEETKKREIEEKLILEVTSNNFSRIPQIITGHNPIKEIINNIDDISSQKIDINSVRYKKWNKYLDLMVHLEIFAKTEEGYTYGDKFKMFESKISRKDTEELFRQILSYVLTYGEEYIKEYIHLMSIDPYLRTSYSYYDGAINIRDLIPANLTTLSKKYREIYKVSPKAEKLKSWISTLVDTNVFERDGDNIIGNQDIFQKLEEINDNLSDKEKEVSLEE